MVMPSVVRPVMELDSALTSESLKACAVSLLLEQDSFLLLRFAVLLPRLVPSNARLNFSREAVVRASEMHLRFRVLVFSFDLLTFGLPTHLSVNVASGVVLALFKVEPLLPRVPPASPPP